MANEDSLKNNFPKFPPISGKLPVFMHGADYNPDQWLDRPDILEEDIRLMKLAHCNIAALGIFSWSALEQEEGVFTFDWLDAALDRLAANGIYALLATPSGSRPAWLSAQYPEVLRVAANRVRNLYGSRHNHCYTSPVYREKTAIINRKLAERYARHPAVVGWHISNEYSGECHCGYCQEAFRQWLKNRYGSLDALNQAWWTSFWSHKYTSWEQVESPSPHGELRLHGLNLAWRRFVTHQTVDFCKHEIAAVRAYNPELPVTTNMMGLHEPLNYWEFADVLDVISCDAYPGWHGAASAEDGELAARYSMIYDSFRSLKGGKPFMLMESTPSLTNWQPVSKLRRPGMHKLSSLLAVAHGSDTVQYFQWRKSRGSSEKFHGAVIDHAGHEHTRVFRDVAELGGTLEKLADVIGTTVPAETAVIFDWENRWAVKDAQGPRNIGIHYEETVQEHYRALWEQGVPVDVVSMDADLSKYKLVVAPMLYMVRQGAGERIEKFVESGGSFVGTYWSGIADENDLCYLGGFPGPLRRTFGIWAEETEGLYDHDRNGIAVADGGRVPGLHSRYESHELCELIHTEGAETLGVYTEDFYAGRPALTVNRLGAGRAYYLATRAKQPFYDDFYSGIIEKAGVKRAIETRLQRSVTVQIRTDGERDFLFLLNFSGAEQEIVLDNRVYTDAETGEAVGAAVVLPVYGVRVLSRKHV